MRQRVFLIIFITIVVVGFTVKKLNLYPSIKSLVGKQGSASVGLQIIKDVPLSGGANRLDYQSIDASTNRLYISHLGSDMVHVTDLGKQKVINDISLTGSPYGILAVPNQKKIYVSIGNNNSVAVIDEKILKVTKYVQAGETPDGIAYYPQNRNIYVSNENDGTVSVISTQTDKKITDIPVGGSVGNSLNFDSQNRIYTVSGSDNKLIEIDPAANKVVSKYDLPGCSHPHGFYIDQQTHYAFITCDLNNVMFVFDLDNKKIIYSDTVGAGPDVLAYDEGLHHLYIAAESGVMSIFIVEKGNIKKIYQGFVATHAHTVAVDKLTHLVYLPLENINGKPVLRILQPASK